MNLFHKKPANSLLSLFPAITPSIDIGFNQRKYRLNCLTVLENVRALKKSLKYRHTKYKLPP